MRKDEFFQKVQSLIEDVVMSAQGTSHGIRYSETEAALDIISLIPEEVWSVE